MYGACRECGAAFGRKHDDCPYCGARQRWTNRKDGRNLLREFYAMKHAQEHEANRYPDPE